MSVRRTATFRSESPPAMVEVDGGESSRARHRAIVVPMPGCVFCAIAAGEAPARLVLEEPDIVGFLDARPVFPGHTLIAPRRHYDTMLDLDDAALTPLFAAARRVAGAMESALGAGGSWVSVNNRVSQSVPHVHVHVVPRTKGDGLRGFFWPRHRYGSDAEADAIAAKLRDGLG